MLFIEKTFKNILGYLDTKKKPQKEEDKMILLEFYYFDFYLQLIFNII